MNKKRLFWILATILIVWLFPWVLFLAITLLGFVIWFYVTNPESSSCGCADDTDYYDDLYLFEQQQEEERAREEERKRRFIEGF